MLFTDYHMTFTVTDHEILCPSSQGKQDILIEGSLCKCYFSLQLLTVTVSSSMLKASTSHLLSDNKVTQGNWNNFPVPGGRACCCLLCCCDSYFWLISIISFIKTENFVIKMQNKNPRNWKSLSSHTKWRKKNLGIFWEKRVEIIIRKSTGRVCCVWCGVWTYCTIMYIHHTVTLCHACTTHLLWWNGMWCVDKR